MHFTLPGQGIDTKYIKLGKTKLKSLFKKSISSFEKIRVDEIIKESSDLKKV